MRYIARKGREACNENEGARTAIEVDRGVKPDVGTEESDFVHMGFPCLFSFGECL